MKQFDGCPIRPRQRRQNQGPSWVLGLQHSQVDTPDMIVVAPLYDASLLPPVRNLRLSMTILGRPLVLAVDRLPAVTRRDLGPAAANVSDDAACNIKTALDLIFSGF